MAEHAGWLFLTITVGAIAWAFYSQRQPTPEARRGAQTETAVRQVECRAIRRQAARGVSATARPAATAAGGDARPPQAKVMVWRGTVIPIEPRRKPVTH